MLAGRLMQRLIYRRCKTYGRPATDVIGLWGAQAHASAFTVSKKQAERACRFNQLGGPQVHARAHLPSLEDKQGIHVDMIDTFGTRHKFRYCSWINNSSRMYLLEGVAPALVSMHPAI